MRNFLMRVLRSLHSIVLPCVLTGVTPFLLSQAPAPIPAPVITPVYLGTQTLPPSSPATTPAAAAQIAPAYAGLSQYRIRAGDTLALDFRLSPELNQTVIVDRDGAVSLEIIGRVIVGGLTLDQAKANILAEESKHLVRPEVNIQLTDFQHFYVVVAGEVYIPQKIEMRDEMTALQAVMLAGGIKISGRETQVFLYRKVNAEYAEVHKLNLHIKKTSEMEHDMSLQPGDLIFVPRNKVESVSRYVRIAGLSYSFNPAAF